MTYAATPQGVLYPNALPIGVYGAANQITLNAAGEKIAMIGRVYMEGRTTSAKTLDTSGSSAIQFRCAGVTFANGSTTLDIGLQGVATGAGPYGQPNGTFTVKAALVGGSGLSANSWNTVVPTTGTKSVSHGELIAVVWDMTARGGADSVVVTPGNHTGVKFPLTNTDQGAGWLTTGATAIPNVVITFSDGTLGAIDFGPPCSVSLAETFADATNPDERGLVFQVPWNCKIDALWAVCGFTDAGSDFTISLYSDPLGTPAVVDSVNVLAENLGSTAGTEHFGIWQLATEREITRNTDYIVAIRATGSSNARLRGATLGDAAHRAFYPGGTTISKYTRDGGAGAFGSQSTTTIYQMGLRISQLDDGTGTGGGGGMVRVLT